MPMVRFVAQAHGLAVAVGRLLVVVIKGNFIRAWTK
jgi:hypothetical protein